MSWHLPDIITKHRDDPAPVRRTMTAGSLVSVEQRFGIASGLDVLADPKAEHLAYLGWYVRRNDPSVGEFEAWWPELEVVQVKAPDDGEDDGEGDDEDPPEPEDSGTG